MNVKRIVVTKSETIELRPETRPYHSLWKKIEYSLEANLEEKDNPQEMKETLLMQIDAWILEEKNKWLVEVRKRG